MIAHLAVTTLRCINCVDHGGINWSVRSARSCSARGARGRPGAGWHYQGEQHRRLTEELEKRADFNVTVAVNPAIEVEQADADSAILRTSASSMNLRFQIGIRNTGKRAATHTTVNFLTATAGAGAFYWTDAEGNRKDDESGPLTTSEELGPSYTTTRWLPRAIDRVAMKTSTVLHATLEVSLPPDGILDVHTRVRATSDDLPDTVEDRVKTFVVHIRSPADQP